MNSEPRPSAYRNQLPNANASPIGWSNNNESPKIQYGMKMDRFNNKLAGSLSPEG